jgi:hypothetical protein
METLAGDTDPADPAARELRIKAAGKEIFEYRQWHTRKLMDYRGA